MSGDNCDTVSAQSGRLGHATRVGVWRKGGLQRWAQRHGAHDRGVRTLARSTTRSHPCPKWGRCNGRTWRAHVVEGVWWFATGPQWLTRAGLASNGRNVALDGPRKSRWSEGFRSGKAERKQANVRV
jgi:hypothetical protein